MKRVSALEIVSLDRAPLWPIVYLDGLHYVIMLLPISVI